MYVCLHGDRLWLVQELRKIETCVEDLLKAMTMRAEIEIEVCMPGYTHLQRAQPWVSLLPDGSLLRRRPHHQQNAEVSHSRIRWSHWICSYAFAFASDLDRLREVIKRVNRRSLSSFSRKTCSNICAVLWGVGLWQAILSGYGLSQTQIHGD